MVIIGLINAQFDNETEAVNVAVTEAVTEAATEAATDIDTKATTEAVTEAVTKVATEAAIEAAIEAAVEATTVNVTEVGTKGITKDVTEAVTETVIKTVTETVLDTNSESEISNATAITAAEPIDIDGTAYLALPEAQHNISSIICIIKFCEKYFRSEKAVIGSLVIVNVQNTTEFHSQLIIMLNEHANYELGVMMKDATNAIRPHGNPKHVVDKAKNYFVVFNRTAEIVDAINQW